MVNTTDLSAMRIDTAVEHMNAESMVLYKYVSYAESNEALWHSANKAIHFHKPVSAVEKLNTSKSAELSAQAQEDNSIIYIIREKLASGTKELEDGLRTRRTM